uniref:Uncharacterized protein n=1 Tax=Mustela putorius furo TaxID=9669 RepID=M3Z0M1_MUSPF
GGRGARGRRRVGSERSETLSTESAKFWARGWTGQRMHLYSVMESFFHPWPDPFPQSLGQGVHH